MKKKLKILLPLLIVLLLTPILIPILPAEAQESDPIGYKITGDVVEIWNPDTTYYFNKSSGIQWTEDPYAYWTRNIFAIGYYSGGEWHKIRSADELGSFNRDIDTDWATYVNATLWKDFNYQGYDLRLGIRYHLKLNDTELSVIIYAKNIGDVDYPAPLGFAWIVTDIDIPNPLGEDRVYINRTYYRLDEVHDVAFTNMTQVYFNYTDWTNPVEDEGEWVTEYLSYYRISDYTQFITLEWDADIPYAVRLQFNGIQEDARITWMVNAGIFHAGQEKSTTLYWADAEGDYIGVWDLTAANADPIGITTDGSNIWIVDNDDDSVYKYGMDGSYISVWGTTAANGNPSGITTDGTYIWVADITDDAIYKYNMAGGYIGVWDLNAANTFDSSITTDGSYIWVADFGEDAVFKYTVAGSYVDNWSLTAANGDPRGITTDGSYIWVTDLNDGAVYKYSMTGSYISVWNLVAENDNARDITTDGSYFWVTDVTDDAVYKYNSSSPYPKNIALDSDSEFTRGEEKWCNATVMIELGVSNLETVDIQVNTSNDLQNFTLRWTQSTNTFSELSDPDSICTLNTTRSTRVNLDGTTDQICFCFAMTGGADGACDVKLTTVSDDAFTDTDLYTAEFTYITYEWSDAGDLINSLFDHFKIPGGNFLGRLTSMVDAFMLYMIDAMTYVVDIVVQPLKIVIEASGWVIRWVTRMVTFVILLGETIHDIFSGSYSSWSNFWDIISLSEWYDFIPIAVFISWMTRLDYQSKLGRNTIEVAISDVQMVYSLLAIMMDLMFRVIDFVINNVMRMIDAIPGLG